MKVNKGDITAIAVLYNATITIFPSPSNGEISPHHSYISCIYNLLIYLSCGYCSRVHFIVCWIHGVVKDIGFKKPDICVRSYIVCDIVIM